MSQSHTNDEEGVDDPISQRVLSDSAYDRVQIERFSHFKQPVPRKLLVHCLLLGALTLALPLYVFYPSEVAAYLPTTDPGVASPLLLVLGLYALVIELGTAMLLVGVVLYRVREEPLTEDQAISLFTTESFATYLGFGTGGFATVVFLGLLAFGLGGESMLAGYVGSASGGNPFRPSHLGVSIEAFAIVALTCALFVYVARGYVATKLARLEQ